VTTPASEIVEKLNIDHGALDVSQVNFTKMPVLMQLGLGASVEAITIGSTIFVAEGSYRSVVSGGSRSLVVHELEHVVQWRRDGTAAFLIRYAMEYLRNRMIGLDHRPAYRAISYEAAAYDVSEKQRSTAA